MNIRKFAVSTVAALAIVAGNAVAAENPPFPSSAHEVGGHWTGKVGRASTPGMDISVFPSAAVEFSSLDNAVAPRAVQRSARTTMGSPFPTAAIEISSGTI